jgi:DNA invertase Pin-like site-specific DNA recombinase
MGDLIAYARISTSSQVDDLQNDQLVAAGCRRVFSDTASGALDRRPELDRCLDHLREGDTLVVYRLDRLGRSLRNLISLIEELEQRGVGFRSLTENIDTTTPGGKLIFQIFGALAEFERQLIIERTKAGLAAARARGRVGGRPRALSETQIQVARSMYEAGEHTVQAIAETLGVSRKTIYRALNQSAEASVSTS